ncbi:hypothetical protein CA803_12380 [Staphylococcus aureus]|nr:hypothetical protein CA803_12380 [Staphylococcus aureus]
MTRKPKRLNDDIDWSILICKVCAPIYISSLSRFNYFVLVVIIYFNLISISLICLLSMTSPIYLNANLHLRLRL